jgi:glycerol-3-phosphate dehydrogenase
MKSRVEELKNIAGKQFDLCVIGGEATDAGCAVAPDPNGARGSG